MIEKNAYIPQPGDWLFLSDNAAGDTSHVAMVEYCTRDDQGRVRVHVIEGNNVSKPSPQSVERNDYALDYWKILGYGTVHDLADITLRFGCDGPKVTALQYELVSAGLLEERYTTGRYGAITTDAVKTVQRQSGIAENGIANLETRLALRLMAEEKAAESAAAP
jgi:peptidoglycan hydrolase-like protein with peptidoglycan-binding domain